MKTIFTIITTLALIATTATIAIAAGPYLVTDPVSGATSYTVTGLPTSIAATSLTPDSTGKYGAKLDISSIPAGTYTVSATACITDSTWGQVCSAASSPFVFTRPGAPAVPTNLGLSVK
ncbi:MAG: hypothetical protein LLG06_07230, partial [Desulfobacteraceae bacterium]|nr:hypothetical protein [Desulfobacteraceae bacterium]